MTKQVSLDRLASLSEASLAAVVEAVEQAVMLGNGLLVREESGDLRAPDMTKILWEFTDD